MTNAPWLKMANDLEKLTTENGFILIKEQAYAEYIVSELGYLYEQKKNPMLVWNAIAQAKYAELDFPLWTLPYISEAALKLYKLTEHDSGQSFPSAAALAAAMVRALGLKADRKSGEGKHGSLKRYTDLVRDVRFYREIQSIKNEKKCTQAKAIKHYIELYDKKGDFENKARKKMAEIKKLFSDYQK